MCAPGESSPETPGGRAGVFFFLIGLAGLIAHLLGAENRRPSWEHVVGVVGALDASLGVCIASGLRH